MSRAARRPNWSERTVIAGRAVLESEKRGLLAMAPFAGPAVVASVAYIDPGNFATNIEAGARYGYLLLWVVVASNLIAMLFQALSAKLGIVTGRSLAEECRERFPPAVVYPMWIVSEIAAMATDLAEFLGAGVGLSLLFGFPLMLSLAITAAITYAFLLLQNTGFRAVELAIGAFVGVIGISYLIELFIAPPDWAAAVHHAFTPHLQDGRSVLLAVGVVGATVMPHAIYLHSSLTQGRMPTANPREMRRLIGFSHREVLMALGAAGLVNMAMMTMAATVFHTEGHSEVSSIETAYQTLLPLLGGWAAAVFMLSLLASGLSSSVVGTMAGQVIMQDFTRIRIPLWARRVITMLPSFAVVGAGADATQTLVLSQVILSLALPVPLVALVLLTSRRDVMGDFVNTRWTTALAAAAAATVIGLNLVLLLLAAGAPIPLPGAN
jgi:manganese transport protein